MKKTFSTMAVAALAAVTLAGCAGTGFNDSDAGTVLGGVAGGALGSQIGHGTGSTIATVVGTLAGAALGNRVGEHFDQRDRNQFGSALESNQTGDTSRWTDPDNNNTYSVTPTQTYQQGNQPCRNFTMDANVNGSPQRINGTACRQPNGTWKVVNS